MVQAQATMRARIVAPMPQVENKEEQRTKVCASCGRELPLSHFPKHRLSIDGHMRECQDCRRRHNPNKASSVNPLEKFTARELMHELGQRGYKGEITYTEVKVHKMRLSEM